jgi:hypothetical protein
MRRILFSATGLLLAPLLGLGLARAGDKPAKPAEPPQPSPLIEKEATSCGSHGTQVTFVDTPKEAAAQAKKEQKLVFVLHVSGNFEDPRFT